MTFNSLEQIKEHYGLEMDDVDALKKELKKVQASIHPDRTGGEYQSRKQERDYNEVAEAILFIENSEATVPVSRKDWALMVKKIDDLTLIKKQVEQSSIHESAKQLNKSIQLSLVDYKKKHWFVKLTSAAVTAIITIIWSFPSIISKNETLKSLINTKSLGFTVSWILILALTIFTWVYAKNSEQKDIELKKQYNLDSMQNSIWRLFLAWLYASSHDAVNYDHINGIHTSKFSKDDLINFIVNDFNSFYKKFKIHLSSRDFELNHIVYNSPARIHKSLLRTLSNELGQPLSSIFGRPGEIDLELAQKLADTIIDKLKSKNLVTVDTESAYCDIYLYTTSLAT